MPKRGQKGTPSKQTLAYKNMVIETPPLCKSMVYNQLYNKLKNENRLDRFIAVVQYCSMSGLDIETTVKTICEAFPSYISSNELDVKCFEDMIKNYSDVAVAWGYGSLGDDISMIIVKNKALQLVQRTENMQDIVMYNEVFGKKPELNTEDKKTTVNFNLFKK